MSKRVSNPLSARRQGQGLFATLEASFRDALRTPEGTVEPVALLCTDADGQWHSLIPQLRAVLPHVYILGSVALQICTFIVGKKKEPRWLWPALDHHAG